MRSLAYQRGLTLIELMVSLVLGLLISAAAIQIFYTSTVSSNIQKAGSTVVETGTFGFDYLTKQIRKANHGSVTTGSSQNYFLTATTPQGGVVLTAPENLQYFGEHTTVVSVGGGSSTTQTDSRNNNLRGLSMNGSKIATNLLSTNQSSLSGSNVTAGNSDQLTIQYQAFSDTTDCEGKSVKEGDFVIERYFVRNETVGDNTSPLGLACASAVYTYDVNVAKSGGSSNQNAIDISSYKKPDGSTGTNNLAGSGQIIIPNVDYFKVKLGVSDSKEFATKPDKLTLENMDIPDDPYVDLNNKRIVNVQVAILVRSDQSVTASSDATFDILGNSVSLKSASNTDGKLRRVLQSTVLVRNARGSV